MGNYIRSDVTVDSLACVIHEEENGLSYTKTGDSLCNGYAQGVQQEPFERMVVKCPEGTGNKNFVVH